MEIDFRRTLHFNVTQHPNAEWTLQQFRECIAGDESYRFVIHDRHRIYSQELDSNTGCERLQPELKSRSNNFCGPHRFQWNKAPRISRSESAFSAKPEEDDCGVLARGFVRVHC
jgi:hypothetical protein